MAATLLRAISDAGVATVTLNRPQTHNAFDDRLIAELAETFAALDADGAVRVMVLAGAGKAFSAGGDLAWMQRVSGYNEAESLSDAMALAEMLRILSEMTKPTVARVQGAAFGGGVGLVAACDIAIASDQATFSLSEVKLGLIPAAISPYVLAAIGARQAGRYFVTGERFDAARARDIGLVHEVTAADGLDAGVAAITAALLANGPRAMAAAKDLVRAVAHRPLDGAVVADTAARIARVRASDEGREGVAAFLEKRKPHWAGGE